MVCKEFIPHLDSNILFDVKIVLTRTWFLLILKSIEWTNERIGTNPFALHHEGMWLSGRASALHAEGPGFDPRHLQFFSSLQRISIIHRVLL